MFSSTTFNYHRHSRFNTSRAEFQTPKSSINQHPERQQSKRPARLDDTDFEPYKAGMLSPHELTACANPARHRRHSCRCNGRPFFLHIAEPSDCAQVDYSTGFPVPLGYYTGGFSSAKGLKSRQEGEVNKSSREEEESNVARQCAVLGSSCLRLKYLV